MTGDVTDAMDRLADARRERRERREDRREDTVTDGGTRIDPDDVPDRKAERRAARDDADDAGNVTPQLAESIDVTKVTSGSFDLNGGRGNVDGELATLHNTDPPTTGWLGNPYELADKSDDAERRAVIAAYLRAFLDRLKTDDAFASAVEDLRGQTVACWCRGITQDRDPSNWCHLDVVAAYLDGDLRPVYDYLRGGR